MAPPREIKNNIGPRCRLETPHKGKRACKKKTVNVAMHPTSEFQSIRPSVRLLWMIKEMLSLKVEKIRSFIVPSNCPDSKATSFS